jgi:hypothetical protein
LRDIERGVKGRRRKKERKKDGDACEIGRGR